MKNISSSRLFYTTKFLIRLTVVSATLAFDAIEGHVGVPLPAQLLLTSQAQNQSTPLVVSNVFIEFEGGLKPIDIRHDVIEFSNMSASANTEVHNVSLEKSSTVIDPSISLRSASSTIPSDHFLGSSDLSLKPGVSKALSFLMHPYDAGTSSVKAIAVTIQNDSFDANIVFSAKETRRQEFILHQGTSGLLRRRVRGNRHDSIAILPKPPKLQIQIPMLLKEYLTDESIILDIILTNKEEDHVKVELEVGFSGERGMLPGLRFVPLSEDAHALELADREDHPRFTYSLDQMNPLESRTARIAFKASSIPLEMVLEIKALYYLISEPDTPMSKIYTNQMVFDRPFEANYEFRPLIDTAMWPNYFQLDESCVKIGDSYGHNTEARGLRQKWYSVARIASFAGQPLDLESVNLQVMNIRDDVACTVETVTSCSSETVTIKPNGFHETYFEITAQKLDLDDREAAFLRLQLEVRWQRHGAHATAVTQIAAPNLVLPFGEPRVLASAGRVQGDAKVIPLDYTIENPSDHVLTFDLSMEASEEFAFSGCKARALQLVPLSRHTIRFNIMPLIHGAWISPSFRVWDTHFHQSLKIHGTGELKNDKKGISIWVDAED